MLWITAAPFIDSPDPEWIPRYVPRAAHAFDYIAADYTHDRSRRSTSARQWADYLRHAWRAWFAAPRAGAGYITAFPQLPVMLGILKRLTRSDRPIVAWMFNLGQTYTGWKGVLARFGLRTVDCFVVHSREEIETYSAWLQLPRERFVFVPLSIRTSTNRCTEDEDDPFIFAMGTANRDYALLFQAAAALGHRTVVVAGEHAVRGLTLPPNVTVLHRLSLEQCHRLAQQARLNVIPVDDVRTASGQVTLLETMMYGKAVIATACTGTVDYVHDGVTARLVPPRDLAALSVAIRDLWDDAPTRAAMGEAARAFIQSSVSFQGVARSMHEILDLASTGAAPSEPLSTPR